MKYKTARERINDYKKRNPIGKLSQEIFELTKENNLLRKLNINLNKQLER